jgi:hypothetical protein
MSVIGDDYLLKFPSIQVDNGKYTPQGGDNIITITIKLCKFR